MGYFRAKIDINQNGHTPFSKNYWYWERLWNRYAVKLAEVQVQCWNEETKQIHELHAVAENTQQEGLVHIHSIELTKEHFLFLRDDSYDGRKLKWFMMTFTDCEGVERLEIRDYGTEVIFNQISIEDAQPIIELFQEGNANAVFVKDEQD